MYEIRVNIYPTNDAVVFVVRFRFERMLSAYMLVEQTLIVHVEQAVATLNAVRILFGWVRMPLYVRHKFGVRIEELMAIGTL